MKDEALRLALEALKTCQIDGDGWSGPHYDFDDEKVGKAIIAIRQALEQPVATNDTSKDRVDETAKQRHEPVLTEIPMKMTCTKCGAIEQGTLVFEASPPKRKPLPPQSPCEMTQAEYKIFKLAWLECEAAHGIKGEA